MMRVIMLVALLGLLTGVFGCKNTNTGSRIVVGDVTSLPKIADAADNISIEVLLMMTGASVWTAKDSLVKVTYSNSYTNEYCGIIERKGNQTLNVEVEPLATDTTDTTDTTDAQKEDSNGTNR